MLNENPEFLSLIIPAYNEEHRVASTLAQIDAYLACHDQPYEIVVVDDGSQDNTREVVKRASDQVPNIALVAIPHAGKGSAVRAGVAAARGTRVIFCDADLPVAPADLLRLSTELGHADVVIGTREGPTAERIGEPFHRHVMGRVFNAATRAILVPGIHDTQCGLKCFRAEIARSIFALQTINGFGFDVEILFLARRLGYRIVEVPVRWSHRPSSRVNPVRDTFGMLCDLARIRLRAWRGAYSSVRPSGENLGFAHSAIVARRHYR